MRSDNNNDPDHSPFAPASIREPERRVRRLLDATGREWRVYEMAPSAYDRRAASSLVFETVDMARRVRDFPADWFDRSEEFLFDLSEHPMRRRSDDCW